MKSCLTKLYTPVPPGIERFLRHEEIEYQREKLRVNNKTYRRLMKILENPKASEKKKRIARLELMVLDDPTAGMRARRVAE